MVQLKLIYFNARGRAESIRLILTAGGIQFEDARISREKDWPDLKPKMPTGRLPVLIADGRMIPESVAIARFAGKLAGLAGRTHYDEAILDAVGDVITPAREAALSHYFAEEEDKAEAMKAFEETSKEALNILQKKHLNNQLGKSYLHFDTVTWADLHFFACVETMKAVDPDVLTPYPSLERLWTKISQLPRVAKYLYNRNNTKF